MPVSFNCSVITGSDMSFMIMSVMILTFATLSVISKSQKLSIINFLLAGLLLSYFIMAYGNIIVGIVVALVYVSMCSLLLMAKPRVPTGVPSAKIKLLLPVIIGMLAALVLICSRFTALPSTRDTINQYTKVVGGITLLVTLLSVVAFTGVSFLITRRHSIRCKQHE